MHCTSSGKVLLAFDEEGILDEYVKEGLKSCTKETITDGDKLRDVLKPLKKRI
ncbi:IclR family transcriptional regulator C-terminal domain-containing protein [Bacillus licheniformis]|nr:IclR family transcriptional regulator C-terminal domain-containing protein [Bacillus licheniformis]